MKYFAFPWTSMMRIGATVMSIEDAHEINDVGFRDGVGGSWRGEDSVNGMKDLRLGNRRELGMICSCCSIANIRKCRVM
jgi:hypothetical protein